MNLLAIDTSTNRATLALLADGRIHVGTEESGDGAGRHGRHLLPTIAAMLDAVGMSPRSLDAIAVGLGPGTYTGLRVGITAGKTLAFALGKPLVAVESFIAVARNAPIEARSVHIIGDAQRGDLYVQDFELEGDREGEPPLSLGPIRVVEMTAWAATLASGSWVLGWGLARLRVDWPEDVHLGTPDQGCPSPAAVVALAVEAVEAGRFVVPHAIEPAYIRRSAAEDQWDRLGGRA